MNSEKFKEEYPELSTISWSFKAIGIVIIVAAVMHQAFSYWLLAFG